MSWPAHKPLPYTSYAGQPDLTGTHGRNLSPKLAGNAGHLNRNLTATLSTPICSVNRLGSYGGSLPEHRRKNVTITEGDKNGNSKEANRRLRANEPGRVPDGHQPG